MNDSKKHNSILFLTTLSVYLGLVLVGGASSPVLAQAAMTRNFDIQEEIEFKDELDKKPDEKDCWNKAPQDVIDLLNSDFLSDEIIDFIADLENLSKIGNYTNGERFDFQFEYKATKGGKAQTQTQYPPIISNEWIRLAASERVENLASNNNYRITYYRYDEELKTETSHSAVKFSFENDELVIKVSKELESDKIAEETASLYNQTFVTGICSDYIEKSHKVIYQNTKAFAENNQVFTITRLPRASIDSLLAETDAN